MTRYTSVNYAGRILQGTAFLFCGGHASAGPGQSDSGFCARVLFRVWVQRGGEGLWPPGLADERGR